MSGEFYRFSLLIVFGLWRLTLVGEFYWGTGRGLLILIVFWVIGL